MSEEARKALEDEISNDEIALYGYYLLFGTLIICEVIAFCCNIFAKLFGHLFDLIISPFWFAGGICAIAVAYIVYISIKIFTAFAIFILIFGFAGGKIYYLIKDTRKVMWDKAKDKSDEIKRKQVRLG